MHVSELHGWRFVIYDLISFYFLLFLFYGNDTYDVYEGNQINSPNLFVHVICVTDTTSHERDILRSFIFLLVSAVRFQKNCLRRVV